MNTQPSPNILVAEDNEINQIIIKRTLSVLGFEADIVSNGIEAVNAAAQKHYDIIFMDLRMPELDGIEASKQIKSNAGTQPLPIVIAMTADAITDPETNCIEAGMDDYLRKPYTIQEIQKKITRWQLSIKVPKN